MTCTTFSEASQARLIIKMQLSDYAWYRSCSVVSDHDNFIVLVGVSYINGRVRKIVPRIINGVSIKIEIEK